MQINDSHVVPLLVYRKDNIEHKLEEFALKYQLPEKKKIKLFQMVTLKIQSLQDFVPEERELSAAVVKQGEFESSA